MLTRIRIIPKIAPYKAVLRILHFVTVILKLSLLDFDVLFTITFFLPLFLLIEDSRKVIDSNHESYLKFLFLKDPLGPGLGARASIRPTIHSILYTVSGTPAAIAVVTDRFWEIEDLVKLINSY